MLVSVILPTLNRAAILPRAMASVLHQAHRDLELILVDDGSTEDIRAVAQSFNDPRVVYVRRDQRGGPAAARNTGLKAARGSLVAFQDSDDEWLPGRLDRMVPLLEAEPAASLIVCDVMRQLGSRVRRYPPRASTAPLAYRDVLVSPDVWVHTQCWLARREALLAAGGFDEALFLWDDWELLIRICRTRVVRYLPEPLVFSSQSGDSVTRTRRWHQCLAHIIAKHSADLRTLPRERAFLDALLARHLVLAGQVGTGLHRAAAAIAARPGTTLAWRALALGFARGMRRAKTAARAPGAIE